jgi:hypothetical protein
VDGHAEHLRLSHFWQVAGQAVDVGLVMKALEQDVEGDDGKKARFWDAKPETATGCAAGSSILDWATVRQYRQGENPAAGAVTRKPAAQRPKCGPSSTARRRPIWRLPDLWRPCAQGRASPRGRWNLQS